MSLEYNVVIIDDQKAFFEDYKSFIEDYLSNKGFIASVDYISSESDFASYDLSKPDLFLIDLKFGQVDQGQIFIHKVRENRFTDILFYSSDVEALKKYRQEGKMQGVFFAEKDEQVDEVENNLKGLLDKMIIRSNSPRATRGIVMECVAELDDVIRTQIKSMITKINANELENTEKKILKLFKNSIDGKIKDLENFFSVSFSNGLLNASEFAKNHSSINVGKLVNSIKITDSYKNLSILGILLKKIYGNDKLYSNIYRYNDLLKKRNILAHTTQENIENSFVFRNIEDETKNYILTEDECLSLRKLIIEIGKCLNEI